MRQLTVVAAGLTLAGILIALTMGVFMEINFAIPTWFFSSRASEPTVSALPQSVQQAKPSDKVAIEATPQPKFVTTTQPVSFAVSYGTIQLPPGTQLEFVSKEGSDVNIRYAGGEYLIPVSATNLK
jgi:hypothetical protein